ncbi:MAG: preprotein translocase subunit SecG [Oligoflexia bacterium]|nr:preprotein translocase subunit SecG [Oligoflexia bacterium]
MQFFVTILHVSLCFALILIILLQPGKEGAAAFGGSGGNQMYGPRGSGHFLGRATTVVAALFMFTSITLALYSNTRVATDSDIEEGIDQLPSQEQGGFDVQLPAASDTTSAAPGATLAAPSEDSPTPDPSAAPSAPDAPEDAP